MTMSCGRCGVSFEAKGRTIRCPSCRPLHYREYQREFCRRERQINPEPARERNRRYAASHREQLREKAKRDNASPKHQQTLRQHHSNKSFGGLWDVVLDRDAHQCQHCGVPKQEGKRNLVVHHKDENRDNNTMENLITLCRACHAAVHRDKITAAIRKRAAARAAIRATGGP